MFMKNAADGIVRLLLKPLPMVMMTALMGSTVGGCAQHEASRAPAPAMTPAAAPAITDAEIRDVISRVAKHQVHPLAEGDYPPASDAAAVKSAKPPEGIAWGYPWGVTLFGMERSQDAVSDPEADNFVVQHDSICADDYHWLAGLRDSTNAAEFAGIIRGSKIGGLLHLGSLDSCGSMGNQMLESMIRHPDRATPEEKAAVARIADWVVHKQDRLPDGTLWRAKSMGGSVWPDDLYMGGVFLVRWGIYNHDPKFIDDAASNIIHQAALEQDRDGLWFHGYLETNHLHAPFKWGRGNGWVTVTLVETLSAMRNNDPLRPKLLEILRNQIEGLKKVQAPDGMWRQVLDRPELWEETSCTAMFAYGIARAVDRGWIAPANLEVARRAFAGLAKNVTPDGEVLNTCHGTNIGDTLNYYIQRPHDGDDPHGHGPVLLAGTELLLAGRE